LTNCSLLYPFPSGFVIRMKWQGCVTRGTISGRIGAVPFSV
jgi:hypothetical protein